MDKQMTLDCCRGCEQDFYNGNNPLGVKRCWSFDDAQIVTRFKLSVDCPMGQRSGYVKMEVPSCYQQKRYIFMKAIPDYVK